MPRSRAGWRAVWLAVLAAVLVTGSGVAQEASPDPLAGIPPLVPGSAALGTLEVAGERDDYLLSVGTETDGTLIDLRLIVTGGPARRVCLIDPGDPAVPMELTCATGERGVALRDLLLAPGRYVVRVDGEPGPDTYALVAEVTVAPATGHETEPNALPMLATPWDAGASMEGWFAEDDVDHYRLVVTGKPQLWRLDVAGDAVVGVGLVLPSGSQLAAAAQLPGEARWSIQDLYLVPGSHWIRVNGNGTGPYSMTATPLGPPDPDSELEPNDLDPELLPVGTSRSGRLPDGGDEDQFRFSLTSSEHIRIRVEPPAEEGVGLFLQAADELVASVLSTGPGAPAEYRGVLAPGDYTIRLTASRPFKDRYRISIDREDPFATEDGRALLVGLSLTGSPADIAAFWPAAQDVEARLTITNESTDPLELSLDWRTSDARWLVTLGSQEVTVAGGEIVDVPLTIGVPPDATRVPVRVTIRARDAAGSHATAHVDVAASRDAVPVRSADRWSLPDGMLGGIDVAAARFGALLVAPEDPSMDAQLHDGVAPRGGGVDRPSEVPIAFTVDLAGDDPVPIAGTILDPVAGPEGYTGVPRTFELLLSEDGVAFETVLTGELSPSAVEQPFLLPEPMPARFAQLRVTGTWGAPGRIRLGEWKVVATPGVLPWSGPTDLADPRVGGHIPWMDPQPGSLAFQDQVLRGLVEDPPPWLVYPRGTADRVSWTVGFQDDRAALVESIAWTDAARSNPDDRLARVGVAISEAGPLGPWRELGTWRLVRSADGSVAPFRLETPTWVRAMRLTGEVPHRDGIHVELPASIAIFEHASGDDDRSILGEWGEGRSGSRSDGPFEWAGGRGGELPDVVDLGNHTPETAAHLAVGAEASGRVQRAVTEDWYTVTIPEDQRSLRITLAGFPTLLTAVELEDAAGATVSVAEEPGEVAGSVIHSANVIPGATYRIRVHQPPVSAVVAFDTSASIDLTPVHQALSAYAADLTPGEEEIQLLPFAAEPLVRDWSADRWEVLDGIRRLVPAGSSAMETGLVDALDLLAPREGTKAVLLLTDAETESYAQNTLAWKRLAETGAVVFPVHVSGALYPVRDRQLMQDLAVAGRAPYTYAASRSRIDVAFDRMATWLRRPAVYALSVTTSADEVPPPESGSLRVVTPPGEDGSPTAAPIDPSVAIEIVLDTSGSMLARLGGTTRIVAAKEVLTRLVREQLPAGTPVAMRWFRQSRRSCDTELAAPLGPLDPDTLAGTIDGIRIDRSVRTPLAAAIEAVPDDLRSATGPRIVVVVSDGRESCGGDPERAVETLRDQGFDVTVNVVGLGLSKADRQRMRRLAELGGGAYFDARRADQLDEALRSAVSAPFEVLDDIGTVVARGSVNGPGVALPPGTYRVLVRTDPEQAFETVVLRAGETSSLELPG